MKLLIDIPKKKYEWIKAHNLNIDNDSIVGAIVNGIPIDTVTNEGEAEDYPINQEENCNIVCDFLRDITGVDIRKGKKSKWIPVSERLPNDLEPVNITWINHEPKPYYKDIKDKPFTATGVYFNGQWYWWSTLCTDILAEYSHNFDDIIDTAIEVVAWQPLPESYKKGDTE